MGDAPRPAAGTIVWTDLTVPDAAGVRDFYAAVVGWSPGEVDMGGYADFSMCVPATGVPAVGICHTRGSNADLPPQWLIYVAVQDVDASAARCVELGGQVIAGPRAMGGHGRYCVIRDPAGAVAALIQAAE